MSHSRLFQAILSVSLVLAFAAQTSAQQNPIPPADSMSSKEFADRKERLLQLKNVDAWLPKDTVFVVNLSVSECTWLGGTVAHWPSCGGTSMKCVGSNGREMCIDTIK